MPVHPNNMETKSLIYPLDSELFWVTDKLSNYVNKNGWFTNFVTREIHPKQNICFANHQQLWFIDQSWSIFFCFFSFVRNSFYFKVILNCACTFLWDAIRTHFRWPIYCSIIQLKRVRKSNKQKNRTQNKVKRTFQRKTFLYATSERLVIR